MKTKIRYTPTPDNPPQSRLKTDIKKKKKKVAAAAAVWEGKKEIGR